MSTNSGSTFATTSGDLSNSTAVRTIEVNPTVAGDVWVTTDAGVFHSTDYGTTFTQPSTTVSDAHAFALGKSSTNTSYTYDLYSFLTVDGTAALYKSSDVGATWTNIQGGQGFGAVSANPLAASVDEADLVFVGTNGRGIFYGTS